MTRPVRTAARAMLATIFVASGARGVLHPDPMTPAARRLTARLSPLMKRTGVHWPVEERTLVQIDHATKLAGGLALLTPLRRPAAAVLAASLVPTTLTAHGFWRHDDPSARAEQQTQFMKNLGLLGGLLLAASDTEGRPGLRWRFGHAARMRRQLGKAAGTGLAVGGATKILGGAKKTGSSAKKTANNATKAADTARHGARKAMAGGAGTKLRAGAMMRRAGGMRVGGLGAKLGAGGMRHGHGGGRRGGAGIKLRAGGGTRGGMRFGGVAAKLGAGGMRRRSAAAKQR